MASEENSNAISNQEFWAKLAIKYWYFIAIFGLLLVGAIIGFILTLDWYIDTSAIGGNGTWTFDQFSLGTAVVWCIFAFLWIFLIVVLPTLGVAGIIVALIWYVVLPPEVKEEIKTRSKKEEEHKKKRGRKTGGGGGFSFIMFIGVCIYVAVQGHWLTPFGDLTYRYFIDAWITVFVWILIIFGIPLAIIAIIWFVRKYGR